MVTIIFYWWLMSQEKAEYEEDDKTILSMSELLAELATSQVKTAAAEFDEPTLLILCSNDSCNIPSSD